MCVVWPFIDFWERRDLPRTKFHAFLSNDMLGLCAGMKTRPLQQMFKRNTLFHRHDKRQAGTSRSWALRMTLWVAEGSETEALLLNAYLRLRLCGNLYVWSAGSAVEGANLVRKRYSVCLQVRYRRRTRRQEAAVCGVLQQSGLATIHRLHLAQEDVKKSFQRRVHHRMAEQEFGSCLNSCQSKTFRPSSRMTSDLGNRPSNEDITVRKLSTVPDRR